jgi:hypothetical protein
VVVAAPAPVKHPLAQHPVAVAWEREHQASYLAQHLGPATAVANLFHLAAVVKLAQVLEKAGHQMLDVGENLALTVDTSLEVLLRTAFQETLRSPVLLEILCQSLDLEGKVDIDQKVIAEGSQVHAVLDLVVEAAFETEDARTRT